MNTRISALPKVANGHWLQWPGDWVLAFGGLLFALSVIDGSGELARHAAAWRTPFTMALAGAFAAMLLGTNLAAGLYRATRYPSRTAVFARAIAAAAIDTVIFYVAVRALAPNLNGPMIGTPAFLFPYTFLVASLRPALFLLQQFGPAARRVLVLGTGPDAQDLVDTLARKPQRGLEIVGVVPTNNSGASTATTLNGHTPILLCDDLVDLVRRTRANEIVVAEREQRGGVLPLRDMLECRIHGVRITDKTAFYERVHGEFPLDSLKASWLIYGHGFEQGLGRRFAKRTTDIVASAVLLILGLPVMAIAAAAIAMESEGPVIYRQERVGLKGRSFQVLKFRSMRTDAEADGRARWAGAGDPRVTRVGRIIRKTRIDELPQLVNVLRGQMSIVGPRPERPAFVEQLKNDIRFYDVRHSVRPGLTGWAQVRFNYAATLEDSRRKLQFDLYYVKNHSLALDLRILFETIRVVLRGEGAR